MSRNSRFEDDNRRQTVDGDEAVKERDRRNAYKHRATQPEMKPHNAVTNETVGAAFAPLGAATANNGFPNVDIGALQQSSAKVIRESAPDETPDRNVGVSATKFFMELEATVQEQMTVEPKPKKNKQSKLKAEESRLKFEQDEEKTSDNDEAESPSDTDEINNDTEHEADADDTDPDKSDTADDLSDSDATDNTAETKEKPKQKKPGVEASDETDDTDTSETPPEKHDSRLQFSKNEKAVIKLEKQSEMLGDKLDKAQAKLPTKKVKKKQLVFDEKKDKTVSKLTHDKEKIPIGEAKWNKPKEKAMPTKAAGVVTSMAVTQIHAKVHQVEHDNVGVKVGHKAELMAESGYRGTKRTANKAYRFHKNRPYRRVAKLEQKSIKNKMKLDYRKALRDNPKLKSNPLSRIMQKRAIKRNYAKDLRAAKKAAQTGKKAVGITAKVGRVVTNIIRKNPVFIIKMALLALIIFLILSMLTMCVGMFSGTSSVVGAVSYPAEIEDISNASVLYTELETDLQVYINSIESNYPGYDEYRISVDAISHDPFMLMAFLSAVYHDFTFAEVESVIRSIFDEQYNLVILPEVEIRTRTEERTGTGSYTDEDGNTHTYTYTYTVEVEYEWHILNVNLTSQPMSSVLAGRMNADQTQHFNILMISNGARQIVGNPFDFEWLPNLTSLYGYRIHPISGVKQFHWGIDIGLPTGTPILAGLTGTVVSVGYDAGGYGNFVVIEDENGLQARYAHCHEVLVSQGQTISRGDVIATVGNTGASTGAHLHMEVSINGQRINPIFFVETGNEGKSPPSGGWLEIPPYPGAPLDDAKFAVMIEEAIRHLGKPYVWGASGPNSFDCSGFVSYVINNTWWNVGRLGAKGLSNICTPVSPADARPGDLVFFWRTYNAPDPNAPTHVGIYIGNGMMIHAGKPVSYASINTTYWQNHFWGFGRLP